MSFADHIENPPSGSRKGQAARILGVTEKGMLKAIRRLGHPATMSRSIFLCCVRLAVICALLGEAVGDEGMWLFEHFPAAKVQQKYGWAPDQRWLDHVRLASVRFPGGSGSFVSPDGLLFTNHHIGADCVQGLSTAAHDYMKEGFYSGTREKEPKCPGLQVVQLIEIADVTKQVQEAAPPGMSIADAGTAQRQLMSKLERACSIPGENVRCQVVSLYSGALYHLYKYKVYRDIRLVMAPEADAAYFGGDPDNFTFPRYDLDICFLRAYENDKPIHSENFLPFSQTGAKEGDLVLVSGNPGNTRRLWTVQQLEYLRDFTYAYSLKDLKVQIDSLLDFSKQNAENARESQRVLLEYQNEYKAEIGYESGLHDERMMSAKRAAESRLQAAVSADPNLKASSEAWDAIAKAIEFQRANFTRITYVQNPLAGDLPTIARQLVRVVAEKQRPSDQRLRPYQDQQLPALEAAVLSAAPLYKSLETVLATADLTIAQERLGANDSFVKKLLNSKTPSERANELIGGTRLDDLTVRKQLWEGGAIAIDASSDPLILLMKQIDPESRSARKDVEDKVDAVVRANAPLIARARFAIFGENVPPDATFTLRLSYGAVKGYKVGDQPVPYFTTFAGALDREKLHDSQDPYKLPTSYHQASSQRLLKLDTPLDTVNTADVIGGNSGSPAVNKQGQVIGIVFDLNLQSLPWNFEYDDSTGRTILTDSRAVLEALKHVYKAESLAEEIRNAAQSAVPTGPSGKGTN